MKLSLLQHQPSCTTTRRSTSFRATTSPSDPNPPDTPFKSLFYLLIHALCCLISLLLGFRFSRIVFFLLFSTITDHQTLTLLTSPSPPSIPTLDPTVPHNPITSRVIVGRHGIRIRPWPHPNPAEVMKAHRIIERVQKEQRVQYGIKNPRTIIVVTPTYVRTFQTLHLTGLMHSLMLVPYDLVWVVVESGGVSEETASIIAKSGLRSIHIGFDERMPLAWDTRQRIEARMRVRALRVVREKKLDGIVMFADDSNMHSMELFDEIQSVKWIGAISVGILAHSTQSQPRERKNLPVPVQGPACNSSGQFAGWHTFNSLPYKDNSATYVDDSATVLPMKLEWAGFVLNSRLVWKDAEDKPLWVRDLDMVTKVGQEIESPLSLLKDASFVEPLGNCGRKVLLSWLRVEARADSKFPPRWIIDPPLEIIVPAKRTTWPDVPPELPTENVSGIYDHDEKPLPKSSRISRTRHNSRSKRKHDTPIEPLVSVQSGMGVIET